MGLYQKKRVKVKPDHKLYDKKSELKELEKQEIKEKIDLYYVDESGFS